MDYQERLRLANLVMRNYNKGDLVPQTERDEEISAFSKILWDVLPYNSQLRARGVLHYHWGKWTPSGQPPCWGPYVVFPIDGEIWRMAMVNPQKITFLFMPPNADKLNYWDAYSVESSSTLDEFIFGPLLQKYQWRNRKR